MKRLTILSLTIVLILPNTLCFAHGSGLLTSEDMMKVAELVGKVQYSYERMIALNAEMMREYSDYRYEPDKEILNYVLDDMLLKNIPDELDVNELVNLRQGDSLRFYDVISYPWSVNVVRIKSHRIVAVNPLWTVLSAFWISEPQF